jgi:hypothetical protein
LKANAGTIGAETFLAGADISNGQLNVPPNRRPDIVVIPRLGVIYTTASDTKKIEHGGFHDEDIHVPILISQPGIEPHAVISPVEIKQIAPTILEALGMGAMELQAVRLERTQVLPGIDLGKADDADSEQ